MTPRWEWALYWLTLLAIAWGAMVIGDEIQQAYVSLSESLKVIR